MSDRCEICLKSKIRKSPNNDRPLFGLDDRSYDRSTRYLVESTTPGVHVDSYTQNKSIE